MHTMEQVSVSNISTGPVGVSETEEITDWGNIRIVRAPKASVVFTGSVMIACVVDEVVKTMRSQGRIRRDFEVIFLETSATSP